MIGTPFEQFTDSLADINQHWPEIRQKYLDGHESMTDFSPNPYLAMGEIALKEIRTRSPNLPKILKSTGVQHGVNVITNFLENSALAARREGIADASQLGEIMHNPKTFAALAQIANHPNTIATEVEISYGLRSSYLKDEGTPNDYQLVNGAIQLSGLDGQLAIAKLRAGIDQTESKNRQCSAHKVNALEPIYGQFVDIATQDEELFPLTLAK